MKYLQSFLTVVALAFSVSALADTNKAEKQFAAKTQNGDILLTIEGKDDSAAMVVFNGIELPAALKDNGGGNFVATKRGAGITCMKFYSEDPNATKKPLYICKLLVLSSNGQIVRP